jgi:hypothetical protein
MAELDATAARNQPYAPRGTNDVDAILRADDADESLQRYKAQLLGAAAKGDRGDASDPQKPVWKLTSELRWPTRSRGKRRIDGVESPWHRTDAATVGRQKCYFHTGGS